MLFELIDFLGWGWLIAFHLIAIGLVGGPFAYVYLRDLAARLRHDPAKDR